MITRKAQQRALVVHPGTQYAPRLAAELAQRGMLHRYWTGFGVPGGGWLDKCLSLAPRRLQQKCANRRLPHLRPEEVRLRPMLELRALRESRGATEPSAIFHRRNARFQEAIPDNEILAADCVIGFDTSSWLLAARCRALDRPLVLDQSIAHPRAKEIVYARLRRDYPAWEHNLEHKSEAIMQAEEQEHANARHIVVASSFTRRSLIEAGVPAEKITIIPYGVDAAAFRPAERRVQGRPLRFAFVGLISARKGVPLLLDIWRRLAGRGVELWLIGPATAAVQARLPSLPGLRVWGAQPHHQVASLIQQCDVLVFPSFFEGFGLVILEAMASGLAVVTTEATAGPDVLDETCGVVVPSGDEQSLEAALVRFIEHPALAVEMGAAAREKAEQMTWARYGNRWSDTLNTIGHL